MIGLTRRRIVQSWADVVKMAIANGYDDAAYNIAVALVRRVRELGYVY